MIFQDPISSLNPRRKVGDIVAEPLDIWNDGTTEERVARRVDEVLEAVGLDPDVAVADAAPRVLRRPVPAHLHRPGRSCIDPKLIICDEPVSALDVSVQAQILNLLEDMKARYGLTLIFIAHDLAVVKNISDRVAVMYLGKLCEVGPPDELYAAPAHPYTAALLAAIPDARPDQRGREDAHARRRDPVAARPAERLPVPHPLPAGPGRAAPRTSPRCARSARATTSPATSPSVGDARRIVPSRPAAEPAPIHGRLTDGARAPAERGWRAGPTATRLDPGGAPRADPRRGRGGVPRAGRRPRSPSRRSPTPPACRGPSSTTTSATAAGCSPRSSCARSSGSTDALRAALDPTRSPSEQLRPLAQAYRDLARTDGSTWRVLASFGGDRHPSVRAARRSRIENLAACWGGDEVARVAARTVTAMLEAASDEDDDTDEAIDPDRADATSCAASSPTASSAPASAAAPSTAERLRSRSWRLRSARPRSGSPVTLGPAGGPAALEVEQALDRRTGQQHLRPVVGPGRVAVAAGPLELDPQAPHAAAQQEEAAGSEPKPAQMASSRSGRSVRASRALARRTSSWWTVISMRLTRDRIGPNRSGPGGGPVRTRSTVPW